MTHIRCLARAVHVVCLAGSLAASFQAFAADNEATGTTDKPYRVVDGYKVDPNTMNGFRAWRAAACDRCHGDNQQGLVGPSLLETFKTLGKEEFVRIIVEGRLEKGMPSFKTSTMVMKNTDGLYAYLKGRANGDISRSRVQELTQ
jgi:mono/diheme cytochrome c family protein